MNWMFIAYKQALKLIKEVATKTQQACLNSTLSRPVGFKKLFLSEKIR